MLTSPGFFLKETNLFCLAPFHNTDCRCTYLYLPVVSFTRILHNILPTSHWLLFYVPTIETMISSERRILSVAMTISNPYKRFDELGNRNSGLVVSDPVCPRLIYETRPYSSVYKTQSPTLDCIKVGLILTTRLGELLVK